MALGSPCPSSDTGPFLRSAVFCTPPPPLPLICGEAVEEWVTVLFSDFLCVSETSVKDQLKEERAKDRYAKHRLTSDLRGARFVTFIEPDPKIQTPVSYLASREHKCLEVDGILSIFRLGSTMPQEVAQMILEKYVSPKSNTLKENA